MFLPAGNPDQIKQELEEVLDLQDEGKNNLTIKLKKKALQGAPLHGCSAIPTFIISMKFVPAFVGINTCLHDQYH